jgi:TRAP transporter 4TM/12TM fusion protein
MTADVEARVPQAGPDRDEAGSYRKLPGPLSILATLAAVGVAVWHIWANTYGLVAELTRNVIHFACFGALCAVFIPPARSRGGKVDRWLLIIDMAIAALVVGCAIYILMRERALSGRSFTSWLDYAVFGATILLAVEFARRTTGIIIPLIILVALGYIAWWGQYVPGALGFTGLSIETVLQRSIYGEDGMFGFIASISSTFVFMFILFGAFLVKSGAGEFIINLARALAGRLIGGPGFVAVFASGLTGTISGSAVANTVSTGVITIPLMKRSGFPARFAGGVEASASTGGQLMPPIMGAGAFVMANLTGIAYFDIVAVAFLPAVMFFLGIAFNVRIVAKKHGLRPLADDGPSAWEILKRGGIAFLLPIGVLIGLLIYGLTPTFAAGFAILAVIVSSWLTPIKMGPRLIVEALVLGVKNMILTAVLLIAVGLVVMTLATTGLGNTFSLLITEWAGGSLLIAILLIAIASLVLGMGLPVTAAYIVLATLSAPALEQLILQGEVVAALAGQAAPQSVQTIFMLFTPDMLAPMAAQAGIPLDQAGAQALVDAVNSGAALTAPQADLIVQLVAIPEISTMASSISDQILPAALLTTALLSAHMIIFWLSQDSNVTPPVCLTAFAAAGIAGTKPMATGFMAWRIAKVLYIVPLLFAYTPFLSGDVMEALLIFGFGSLGVYALVAAIEGHAEGRVPWFLRPVMAGIGVLLLWPIDHLVNAAGAALLIAFMVWNVASDRRRLAAT